VIRPMGRTRTAAFL